MDVDASGTGPVVPSPASVARLRPVRHGGFRLRSGHWAERERLAREVGLPGALRQLEAAGSVDNLRRLRSVTGQPDPRCAPLSEAEYRGPVYSDSDVYKVMEAMAWSQDGDAAMATTPFVGTLDQLTALLVEVQAADGYLNSWFQSPESPARWSDLAMGHEMYCAGHLIQAAVARQRSGPPDEGRLMTIARRLADHLVDGFGDGDGVCGHPLIESALVELFRSTGQARYLDLATALIDRRGRGVLGPGPFGAAYYQDDVPVRVARELRGHCVRALYLAAGATDVYLETGDGELLAALEQQWSDTVSAKTYLTGGMGCRRKDEAFGAHYELPPDQAFAETCAAVAAIGWSWRLLLATGQVRYADLIERILFNTLSAAMSLDGTAYFYINTLHRRPDSPESGDKVTTRRPWFRCACCPPNLLRLMASVGFYFVTSDSDGVQLHQFADGVVRCDVGAGQLALDVTTDYPRSGQVRITVTDEPGHACAIALRQPEWCRDAVLRLNGVRLGIEAEDGYLVTTRRWRTGDELTLSLAMPVRIIEADPRVDAVRGCIAVERGPVVYCAEQTDVAVAGDPAGLDDLALDPGGPIEVCPVPGLAPEIIGLRARGRRRTGPIPRWPYDVQAAAADSEPVDVRLIPYYAWGNRASGGMRVWLPRA